MLYSAALENQKRAPAAMPRLLPVVALTALLAALPALAQLRAPPPPPPSQQGAGAGAPLSPGAGAPGPGAPAAPQQDPLSRDFRECMQKAQSSAQAKGGEGDAGAFMDCLTAEQKRQESKLAQVVGRLAKFIGTDDKKRLDEANAAWRRFRDANCTFFADPKGAPPINLRHADCRLNVTVGRALELDQLAGYLAQRPAATPGAAPASGGGDAKADAKQ
jgi:uncharacterized protein YecT (DUF1311 family)